MDGMGWMDGDGDVRDLSLVMDQCEAIHYDSVGLACGERGGGYISRIYGGK